MSACGGFLTNLWNGNAIVCNDTFKQSQIDSGQAEIQSAVDNAPDSAAQQVGQQVANAQKLAFVSDVNAIFSDVAKSATAGKTCDDGSPGIDLTLIGLPCLKYSWFKWGAVAVAGLILLYVLALANSIVPRRG